MNSRFDDSATQMAGPPPDWQPAWREAQLFWRLRWRVALGVVAQMLHVARLRATLVVFLSTFFWLGLFLLFYEGFRYLTQMNADIVQPLYNAFFMSLMVMLTFSSGIILYTGLFRSPESMFLLTTPARPERIFAHKFHESIWFSSWGFVLLGSPMLVAYGVVAQAPWYYFAMLLPFLVAFVYIPAALGGLLCLVLVYRLASLRLHALTVLAALLLATGAWAVWELLQSARNDLLTVRWFNELFGRLQVTEQRMLPSWWLSTGLIEATRPQLVSYHQPWAESLKFLALLVSNALFFHLVACWAAQRLYRPAYSRLHCERVVRRRTQVQRFDQWLGRGPAFVPRAIRLLLVKDLRLFRRDPVQWSQFLIFFGLLALYFVNIRRFRYNEGYSAMIGFLNLAVVGLILSTFTTRFIYPMISLEGQRFWILGRLPIRRDTILWSKFIFAAVGSLLPCCLLVLVSDLMLQIAPWLILLHQLSCVVLCLGLSGIAVGLGAMMPDLRENSPSKIAAGFGGTLNLVLSAMFIMVVVLLLAVPCHLYMVRSLVGAHDTALFRVLGFLARPTGIATGLVLSIGLGVLATIVPMRMGLKAFRAMEF